MAGEKYYERDLVGESWKNKEIEKFLLSRKYFDTCHQYGRTASIPTLDNIKLTYGAIMDYVSSIPVIERKAGTNQINPVAFRNELIARLDKVGLILYGSFDNEQVKAAMDKLHIRTVWARSGVKMVQTLTELPLLVQELGKILTSAGDFSVKCGLRVMVSERKPRGMEKMLEEEGFDFDDGEEE